MPDGRLWFKTKIDNSNVDKDLEELRRKIRREEDSITKNENAKLPLLKKVEQLNKELTEAKRNLDLLKADMEAAENAMSSGASVDDYTRASEDLPALKAAVAEQEKEIARLQKQWDAANEKVEKYDRAIQQANTDIERCNVEAQELSAKLTPAADKMQVAFDKASRSADKFSKQLLGIAKRVFIFNVLYSGLRAVAKYMGNLLETNAEYTSQLAQLKGALAAAFQPIYEFILPGLLAVLRVLTNIANFAANVFSFFSGKSALDSAKNAKALNQEAEAINAVGGAAKDAKKQLMGFDEINKLSATDAGGGGSGNGSELSKMDFSAVTDMSDDLLKILGIVSAIGAALLAWKVASFFTEELKTLGGIALIVAGAFLYGFNWADAFINGLDWGNLIGMLVGLLAVAGGLMLVFGPMGAAIGLLVGSIGLMVLALREWITTGELSTKACAALVLGLLGIGGAIGLLTGSWIPLIIAAVAGFVLAAVTNGEELKRVFGNVAEWFQNTFVKDWTKIFGITLGTQMNLFLGLCSAVVSGVMEMLSGLIDFLQGVFTGNWQLAWDGLVAIGIGAANLLIGCINAMIATVTNGINALFRLLSFNIDLPNGGSIGISLPQFTPPQIPPLAQGAVIPANAPFLAMLGDQRHGQNLEAPEDLIRQIVREESGGESDRVVRLLETLIAVVEGIEIGDETIGRAAARYNRSTARARGY